MTSTTRLTGYAKLTWQATPRNKITAYYEDALRCTTCNFGGSATASPETTGHGATHPDGLSQLTWTSPLTKSGVVRSWLQALPPERWGSDSKARLRSGHDSTSRLWAGIFLVCPIGRLPRRHRARAAWRSRSLERYASRSIDTVHAGATHP